jgi:hypothetical protein
VRAVYDLGFDGLRITVPFGDRGSFLAAIPYVRAARALGIDAVVILADFAGFTLARALHDDDWRGDVLHLYSTVFAAPPEPVRPGMGGLGPKGVGRVAFQVLNEPSHFLGVPPDVYVHEFLAPCFTWLKARTLTHVVSAAEVENVDGPARIRYASSRPRARSTASPTTYTTGDPAPPGERQADRGLSPAPRDRASPSGPRHLPGDPRRIGDDAHSLRPLRPGGVFARWTSAEGGPPGGRRVWRLHGSSRQRGLGRRGPAAPRQDTRPDIHSAF